MARSYQDLAWLAEASLELAGSADFNATTRAVVRLAVPALGDWCTLDLVEHGGLLCPAGAAHADPARSEAAHSFHMGRPGLPNQHPTLQVMRTGTPRRVRRAMSVLSGWAAQGAERSLEELGISSALLVRLEAEGQPIGVLTLHDGHTSRPIGQAELALAQDFARRAALALAAAARVRDSRRALAQADEYLSVAAHDLRSPITGIRGYAQLLRRAFSEPAGPSPVVLARALKTMDEQSDRLNRMIMGLLDTARIQSGRLQLRPEDTDVHELLTRAMAETQGQSRKHVFLLRAQGPGTAWVDAARIGLVIANILDNAVRYSPEGGRIVVRLRGTESQLVIAVRDHGVGIPRDRQQRIFDRYYQAHDGQYGGQGLGLYVARQVVEMHGGRIEVKSPSNGGTRVMVSLPRQAEPSAPS